MIEEQLWLLMNRWRQATPEQMQENLFLMLKSTNCKPSPELWFAMGKMLDDYFKVQDVEVVEIDITPVSNYFNSVLYPVINSNGGRFTFEDNKWRSCSLNSFQEIMASDIVKFIKYVAEFFDCENFAKLFQSRLAVMYNINTYAWIATWYKGFNQQLGIDEIKRHSWGLFFDKDGHPWGQEPQIAQCWDALKTVQNPMYQLSQIDTFHIG
jgi:hypothetical protein